jgi:hypothetical protein
MMEKIRRNSAGTCFEELWYWMITVRKKHAISDAKEVIRSGSRLFSFHSCLVNGAFHHTVASPGAVKV